ncbi:hypothetical protein AMECASPLE_005550 [Ameca splendens]|uniref:Protein DBF4 homolog A n=1 Tax=Ameca splendens TaxID=208324 RepID=A0ABV0ZA58_9TELE
MRKKMKPKRSQNHPQNPGPNFQGTGINVSEKASVSKAKQTSRVSSSAQVKPFAGKVFYLDLQSNRTAETLEKDIKLLGGTVEKFFSKQIKYLVSNKREAKHVHCLRQDSPVPSPDSGQTSPHPNPHRPSNHVDNVKSRSQGQVDTLIKSRGKSLVERVVTGQGRVQMDRILSNALEWGAKILYLHDVLAYVQKKKKIFRNQILAAAPVKSQAKNESSAKLGCQKWKAGRITKTFIKVEDSSRHYCPIHLTMPNLPAFNLTTAAPYSPFCVEEKDPSGIKQLGHGGGKASGAEEKGHGRKKNREKKRGGYCECCMVKYDQLKMHLQSERHKAFSRSDEYLVVDRLVSTLHFNFLPIKTKATRPKCSVSSVLLAPGPCGEAVPNIQGDASHSETIKAEEDRIVAASEGSYSGQHFCAKRDRRNCYTYSVQNIQRKIKVYKRKRRKVDTNTESAEPEPKNSMLKLWEIFQSSDDTDVEFHGFTE